MILVLTGAGISAESGLSTFRDKDGLWKQASADLATPEAFAANPQRVLDFYNRRRAQLGAVEPNAAHRALAKLEASGRGVIVTQNVDDLHERGGGRDVIHMHGQLMQDHCAACGHRWAAPGPITLDATCPECGGGPVRPDVVWFGERPNHMDRISTLFDRVEMFVAIGTSAAVYPAAGFVEVAREMGARTLEINLHQTDRSGDFEERIIGPAAQVVPAWVESVLSARAQA